MPPLSDGSKKGEHLRRSSDHAICLQVTCLPSLQEHCCILKALYQPHQGPLKLQSLSPTGWKTSPKSVPLAFPVSGFEEVFSLCDPVCSSLSQFSPVYSTCDSFLPQTKSPHLLPSTMWPSLSNCAVCFVNPQINFLDIQNDLIVI